MREEREAVVALINYEGRILLGKKLDRAEGFLKGKWHVPGETLEDGETDEEGLIRGIREEAGIEIKVSKYLASHQTPKHTLVKWYECEALTYEIHPGSDLERVEWISRSEVPRYCGEGCRLWHEEIKEYFGLG